MEGEDVPMFVPNMTIRQVGLVIEESTHYSITRPEAEDEWLYNAPWGSGGYRLGRKHRGFYLSMFHQLHCLRRIREAYTDATPDWSHVQHCLTVLRQIFLCQCDLTLEAGDFTRRNFDQDRVAETHICQDWEDVYDSVNANYLQWYRIVREGNLTSV